MKNLQRVILVTVVGLLIVPQFAFAAWWNPFTWNIFSWFNKPHAIQTQTQVATTTLSTSSTTSVTIATTTEIISEDDIVNTVATPKKQTENKSSIQPVVLPSVSQHASPSISTITTTSTPTSTPQSTTSGYATSSQSTPIELWDDLEAKYFSEATQKGWLNQTITNSLSEQRFYRFENGLWVRKNSLAEAQQPYKNSPPPNTIPCNGTNWTLCPAGQSFVCPPSGNAYCQAPPQQIVSPPLPQITATGLTQTQVDAVLSLLSSFGASQGVISNIHTVLNGQSAICIGPAGLTQQQTQAILSLLSSFGASQGTISTVQSVFSGANCPTLTTPPPMIIVLPPQLFLLVQHRHNKNNSVNNNMINLFYLSIYLLKIKIVTTTI